jgi:dTDP-4-amino-4,6-dideoxygalactose transaminase
MASAERALEARYPGRDVVLTESGTGALTLALGTAAPSGSRTPLVALPAYACPDVGTAVIGAGGRIVLYDVEPRTLAPDLDSVARALAHGATHLVAVHLLGRLVDVAALADLATTHGAIVVEDAAQHAGGTWQGIRGGALADWSILSFGRGKGLNAGGGGALLHRHQPAPAAGAGDARWRALPVPTIAESVRTVLMASATEWWSRPSLYWLPASIPALRLGDTVYHPPVPVRAMRTASAVLLGPALDGEPELLRGRRRVEAWYREALADLALSLDPPPAELASGALRYPVLLPPDVGEALGTFGVARSYPRTLLAYPEIARHVVNTDASFPGAATLADTLHTLPTHARATAGDRQRLLRALRAVRR